MKIAALVTIGALIIGFVLMVTSFIIGETYAPFILKALIVGPFALAWAIRTLKKELQKEKLLKELEAKDVINTAE